MGGPGWWTASLAVIVAAASLCCLGHLLLASRHPRRTLDAVDVLMGGVMVAMLVGVPLGRTVAWVALAGFGAVALATVAGPAVAVGRGGGAVVGAKPAVLCGAMVVMLVPLALGEHHAAGGTPGLVVAAALTAGVVLALGADDLVGLRRARGARLVTGCRLAMGLAAVVMLVELIH